MNHPGRILIALVAGMSAVHSSLAGAIGLDECYRASLARSEAIADQLERVTQAEERYRQAVGAVLPTVNGVASYQIQEVPGSASGSSFFPERQPLVKLTLNQPLFRGFREFAALRQTQALREAEEGSRERATALLFLDVGGSFFRALSLERELVNIEMEIDLHRRRGAELKGRARIGRSRQSEVLNVEASIAALAAEVERVRGELRAERERFAFLTGLPRDAALADPGAGKAAGLEPLERYLSGIESRPEVRAAKVRAGAFDEGIAVAHGAHLPSVDATGNYYLKRSGVLKDVRWDATVSLTLPIFAGGATQSRVREAESQSRQADLGLSLARRQADEEIRMRYEGVKAAAAQLSALEEAKSLATRNYEQQSREYRLGLVTNVEVLQALAQSQQTARAFDRQRYALALERERLEVAAARRPAQASAPASAKPGNGG